MTLSTLRVARALQRATLLFTLLLVGWSMTAQAATITVNTTDDERNNDGDCALREAIIAANTDAAVDGCTAGSGADRIEFAALVLTQTVTLGQAGFVVTSPITIDGSLTLGRLSIDGSWLYRIFEVGAGGDLMIWNMDLMRGIADQGAGVIVRESGTFSATNISFEANRATGPAATDGGGAIYAYGTIGQLANATFTDNEANGASGSGGAVFINGSDATITTATFTSNTANRAGGAIELRGGSLTLGNVDFMTNDAGMSPGNGGAFHITGAGSADITGGTVTGNTAVEGGGFWNSSETMRVTGTTFTGNVASGDGATDNIQGGGAIYNEGGLVVVVDVTATGNSATGASGSGGAFLNGGGAFWVMMSTVSDNIARRAGGGFEDTGGTAVLVMSTFDGNTVVAGANPGNGGAVHSGGGTVVVAGGTYSNNAAVEGGGLWTSGTMVITADETDLPDPMVPGVVIPTITPATISDNTARGNDADQGGGGLYATPSGVFQVFEARILQNVANGTSGSGGGIFSAGDLLLEGTEVTGNRANRAGGGIEDAGGTVRMTDVTLSNNEIGVAAPGNGGGLHSGGGDVTIIRSTIVGNTAVEGGGLWSNGTLTINDGADGDRDEDEDAAQGDRSFFTSISGNEATGDDAGIGGGGVYMETNGSASIRYALINNNTASGTAGSGGGLFVADGASATVSFTDIRSNTANRAGGGIELFDDAMTTGATTVSLRQVYVGENAIDTPAPGNGGGLHAGGAATVDAIMSTFAGNDAAEGGGLWINSAGSLTLSNSTVSGNSAINDGGGVYDNGGATLDLSSVTVASNTAGGNGGGLVSESDAGFSIQNTIVGTNSAGGSGADCFGTFSSGDFNMITEIAGCTLTGGDPITNIIGADPVLEDLAYNGGFTPTRGLMIWSRAIDTGNSTFDVDQRGRLRTFTADDRGAFEFEGADVATGDEPDASTFSLGAPQPNPATRQARVTFSAASAEPVELALFNVLGQRVQTVFSGPASAEQTVDLDVSGLAAGVYILRLSGAAGTETRQITVAR